MATFKRLKLFTNMSTLGPDNILYDEVWVYKLTTDNGTIKQKYRIRYQRTDNPIALGFDVDEAEAAGAMLEQFGPAVSCNLEVWSNDTWQRCLDWMGEPTAHLEYACHDLNEQFKAFITCTPIDKPFVSDVDPPSDPLKKYRKEKKPSKPNDNPGSKNTKPIDDSPDFDWI